MGLRNWFTTLGLGAGLMYLYDPQSGRRRRAQLSDQWTHMQNEAEDFWGKAQRDLQNRAQGMQHRAQSVKEHAENLPGISAMQGGKDGMQENLRNAQQGVQEGVQNVKQSLQESAQGMQKSMGGQWSPGVRLLAGLAGGGLTFYGMTHRGLKGTAFTLFGFNLLSHGFANTGLRSLINVSESAQSITFNKTLTVHAPTHEVYEFWRNYKNFSLFMSHVQEVRDLGNGRSHWVVLGPAGQTVEWDAVTTEMEPDRTLAWESLPGAQVHNNGRVRFEPAGSDQTRITVYMSYRPPAGVLGHVVASLFGADPKTAMDEDMGRLKSLLETGKTTTEGRKVSKQDVSPKGGSGQKGSSQQQGEQPGDMHASGTERQSSQTGQRPNEPQATFSGPSDASSGQHGKSQAASVHSMGERYDTDITSGAGQGQGDVGAAGFNESGASELHMGATEADDADLETGSTAGFDSMIPGAINPPDMHKPDVFDPSKDD